MWGRAFATQSTAIWDTASQYHLSPGSLHLYVSIKTVHSTGTCFGRRPADFGSLTKDVWATDYSLRIIG